MPCGTLEKSKFSKTAFIFVAHSRSISLQSCFWLYAKKENNVAKKSIDFLIIFCF